jgi:hypothetical protein
MSTTPETWSTVEFEYIPGLLAWNLNKLQACRDLNKFQDFGPYSLAKYCYDSEEVILCVLELLQT